MRIKLISLLVFAALVSFQCNRATSSSSVGLTFSLVNTINQRNFTDNKIILLDHNNKILENRSIIPGTQTIRVSNTAACQFYVTALCNRATAQSNSISLVPNKTYSVADTISNITDQRGTTYSFTKLQIT